MSFQKDTILINLSNCKHDLKFKESELGGMRCRTNALSKTELKNRIKILNAKLEGLR